MKTYATDKPGVTVEIYLVGKYYRASIAHHNRLVADVRKTYEEYAPDFATEQGALNAAVGVLSMFGAELGEEVK